MTGLLPAHGVYASRLRVIRDGSPEGPARPAVTNVGTRPTFEPGRVLTEAHVLDFQGDLYGASVSLSFEAKIRDERRFSGPDELKVQIAADADRARSLLQD